MNCSCKWKSSRRNDCLTKGQPKLEKLVARKKKKQETS